MTDLNKLKRAAEPLREACPGRSDCGCELRQSATALDSLAERMGQQPVAWEHHYRKIAGGRSYVQADCGGPDIHPDPDEGYEWLRATPLYAVPQPTPDEDLTRALAERDALEERATDLAEAVGKHLGVDVGEWSSANDPISAAMEAIEMREQERARMVDRAHLRLRASMERVDELPVHPTSQPTPEDVRDAARLDWLESMAHSRSGVSADYAKYAEDGVVLERGYRVGWWHHIGERFKTLREAIDAAMQQEQPK